MDSIQSKRLVPALPNEVRHLVDLCKVNLRATEVWLFGSQARGDAGPNSDYDIVAILPDDAPPEMDHPVVAFRLRRRSGAHADLLTARMGEFMSARDTPNTISYAVSNEGIRLDA